MTGRTVTGGSFAFQTGWEFPGGLAEAPVIDASTGEFTLYYRSFRIGGVTHHRIVALKSWGST